MLPHNKVRRCVVLLLLALAGCRFGQNWSCYTSLANLNIFAVFAFLIAGVCTFVTACYVSKQMCISASLRPLCTFERPEVLRQLLGVPARTAAGWNAGMHNTCLSTSAMLVSLVAHVSVLARPKVGMQFC